MFDNLIKELRCLAVRGETMDYKETIIDLVKKIEDERVLRIILSFITGITNGKKSSQ